MYLGIDWGEKHIGVSISDADQKIASPLKTIRAKESIKAVQEIKKICQQRKINKIIIGIPKSFHGKTNQAQEKVKKFSQLLKNELNFDIEIEFENEVFTSKIASKINKSNSHKSAACLILQSYLDRENI